jgi:hypothetical protein
MCGLVSATNDAGIPTAASVALPAATLVTAAAPVISSATDPAVAAAARPAALTASQPASSLPAPVPALYIDGVQECAHELDGVRRARHHRCGGGTVG